MATDSERFLLHFRLFFILLYSSCYLLDVCIIFLPHSLHGGKRGGHFSMLAFGDDDD